MSTLAHKKFNFRLFFLISLPLSWATGPLLARLSSKPLVDVAELIPLKCPLNFFCGIKCPTCGLGHSLIETWSGNWSHAWAHHFLGPAFYAGSVVIFLMLLLKQDPFTKINFLLNKIPTNTKIFFIVAYCVWGFARNFSLSYL